MKQLVVSTNGFITITENTLFDSKVTPQEAWDKGTTTALVNKRTPSHLKLYLYGEVARLVKFIDAKKTLQDEEEIKFTVETLIEEFPVMRVEEWQHVFDAIKKGKYGKLYERLKTQEIVEICRLYEGDRAEMIERKKHEEKVQPKEWNEGLVQELKKIYENTQDNERD